MDDWSPEMAMREEHEARAASVNLLTKDTFIYGWNK